MSTSSTVNARGLLGRKLGMTQVWDDEGKIVPVTVLAAETNVVTQIRTAETDGYTAVQIGFGEIDGRKRHGFAGVSASHGAHRNHRKPGSIGACATPGRVFKGLRMAGHMGAETVTTQNLTVHAVDVAKGVILVKGAVPGPKGGLVVVRSAVKSASSTGVKGA